MQIGCHFLDINFLSEKLLALGHLLKHQVTVRSNLPKVFLGKSVLKICSKFTGEHPCRSDTLY